MRRGPSVSDRPLIAEEIEPGVIQLTIAASAFGQAGAHWRSVLARPNHGGYGRIYLQRHGAEERRRIACHELRGLHRGNPAANQDECPGAMFIWTSPKAPSTEYIDAIDNQRLGRALRWALDPFKQHSPEDLWEVRFRFA